MSYFNIHTLSNSDTFYVHDETIDSKGSKDVASVLCDFIFVHSSSKKFNILLHSVTLVGSEQKVYTRFLYYVVHIRKTLLSATTMIFPI